MDLSMLTVLVVVLVLAGFLGYHVILGVTPALHTPLMAVTNAISGIVIVAAMIIAGASTLDAAVLARAGIQLEASALFVAQIFGFLGVLLASINIFGGFVLTNRMLRLFKRKQG